MLFFHPKSALQTELPHQRKLRTNRHWVRDGQPFKSVYRIVVEVRMRSELVYIIYLDHNTEEMFTVPPSITKTSVWIKKPIYAGKSMHNAALGIKCF